MRVFVTGGSGFIGQPLVAALRARGDEVVALTRKVSVAGASESVEGELAVAGAWQERVAGCDAVVHLAGEPIAAHRFNAAHKQRIVDSRVDGTARVVEAMAGGRARVLICASGADYYPFDESDKDYAESAPPGDTFLARVCVAWERAAAAAPGRSVVMRTGLVLGKHGGALAKMATAFKAFAGGPMGSGRQWVSWVHLEDVVAAYLHALDHEVQGPINLVAPEAARQRDFARTLGRALHRPSWLPTPGFAIRAAVGELADYLLHGRRVVPDALSDAGFAFGYPHLATAIAACL